MSKLYATRMNLPFTWLKTVSKLAQRCSALACDMRLRTAHWFREGLLLNLNPASICFAIPSRHKTLQRAAIFARRLLCSFLPKGVILTPFSAKIE